MIRAISSLSKFALLYRPYCNATLTSTISFAMSGLKVRSGKKSTSTVLAELSSEYMVKNSDDNKKGKSMKDGSKAMTKE